MSKVTYEARPSGSGMTLIDEVSSDGEKCPVARAFRKADGPLFAAALNMAQALPDDVDPMKAVEAVPLVIREYGMRDRADYYTADMIGAQYFARTILTRIKKEQNNG